MELLQQGKAIFYHPCNDKTEYLKTQDWTESTPTYAEGKVGSAVGGTAATSPSFGAESEFMGTGSAYYIATARLGATKFAVCYQDGSGPTDGKANATVSGSGITWGPASASFTTNAENLSAAALDSTRFVVSYIDKADGNHGTARIGVVSGTGVTFGPEKEWRATSQSEGIVAALGASDQDDGEHGKAAAGAVSGTDITFGAEQEFLGDQVRSIVATALDPTRFVVGYQDVNAAWPSRARLGTCAESEYLSTGSAGYNSAVKLTSSAFAVCYTDAPDSAHGTAKVGSLGAAGSLTGAGGAYDSAAAATKVAFCGWLRNPSA